LRVKYGGRIIDVENQSEHPRREFYADWNHYTISIQKEKVHNGHAWYVQLTTPQGGYDYDGYYRQPEGNLGGTMSEALQDCFDNIDFPPMSINEDEGEQEEKQVLNFDKVCKQIQILNRGF
jgi:hypothetical protein